MLNKVSIGEAAVHYKYVSKKLRRLNLFLDKYNLIRAGSKIPTKAYCVNLNQEIIMVDMEFGQLEVI